MYTATSRLSMDALFVLPTLHDRNISLYREVYAKQGTQQHRWFCYTVSVELITAPTHTPGITIPQLQGVHFCGVQFNPARPWYLARRPSGNPRDGSLLPDESGGSGTSGGIETAERGGGECGHREGTDYIGNPPSLRGPRPAPAGKRTSSLGSGG